MGQDTYSSSTSSSAAFLFLLGLRDPKSKTTSASTSAGGGEEGGVWPRLDEEEAGAFFFTTAALANFLASAALVWRADPSWVCCGCAALPGQTGSPELARHRTRPLPVAEGSIASASSDDDSSTTSSTRGAPVPALLAFPAASAY